MIIQIEPWIDNQELKYLKKVIKSTFLVENEMVKSFENTFCKYVGVKHSISVCNATMGLYVALKGIGLDSSKDEVIVPDMTFIATSNSVIMAGGTPILCDVRRDNCCLDENILESKINKNTKAIIVVHLYGMSANIEKIIEIGKKYNIPIIEDCAQSLGVIRNNVHTGMLGACGVFSLYGNKVICSGEGGVVITNDDELKQKFYRLKNHGRDKKGFIHEYIGFNFCFTDLQAAVALSQMEKLNKIIEKKEKIYNNYVHGLRDVEQMKLFNIGKEEKSNYWFSSFLFKNKNELSRYLLEQGIQTRDFFYPLHRQPCYSFMNLMNKDYENSNYLYDNGLSLPSSFSLTKKEQKYIIKKIVEFYNE